MNNTHDLGRRHGLEGEAPVVSLLNEFGCRLALGRGFDAIKTAL